MKLVLKAIFFLVALTAATSSAFALAVGQPAPAFEVKDTAGKVVKLSDFKGKHVVLEWTNPSCPFVQKHYGSQNMQGLQKDAAAQGVAWLSISSTAPGHSEYLPPTALAAKYQAWGSQASAMLMDDDGRIGKAYAARTTPHMYVVDPQGVLVYAGGIDDKRSTDPADVTTAKNFVKASLGELLSGRAVSTPTSAPYGCSIKYAG
jgi:hypothetical protein